jgi:hypothetical protein
MGFVMLLLSPSYHQADARQDQSCAWLRPPFSPARHGLAACKPGRGARLGAWVCLGMGETGRQRAEAERALGERQARCSSGCQAPLLLIAFDCRLYEKT